MRYFVNTIIALSLLLSAAVSCQKATADGAAAGQVTISVETPVPATKTIADGTNAKTLYYAAFVDGAAVPSLCSETELDAEGKAVLSLSLVKNVTYRFVFWAQTPVAQGQDSYYDLSTFYVDSKVTVDYASASNDDLRDAFCAAQDILMDGQTKSVTVALKRPFAQVNFMSSDYEQLKQLGLHDGMLSGMVLDGVADVIKVLDGSVSYSSENGAAVKATYAEAAIPSGDDEYITYNGTEYGYVGMNYVLASQDGENITVKGTFVNGTAKWETALIGNVPVKANYRTNIIGEFFVEHGTLRVEIQPGFNTPDMEP